MEVKNPQAAILSNFEVLSLLNEMRSTSTATNQETGQLATVLYETSHYLQELPCSHQDPSKIDNLMSLLRDFPITLTKLEKLMICNSPPQTALQLSLIVKDCDDRISEADIELLLSRINEALS